MFALVQPKGSKYYEGLWEVVIDGKSLAYCSSKEKAEVLMSSYLLQYRWPVLHMILFPQKMEWN